MKRILGGILAALFSLQAFATTFSPIQLLNPAGSVSGQVIASTGASSAPVWATVTLSGLGGLAAANNLSDLASVSAARTNLGLGTAALVNTGTSGAAIPLLNTANTWTLGQSFLGLITPSSTIGVKGTTTNDSAQVGSIGEIIAPAPTLGTSASSGVILNATSTPLTAGDWDVECTARFNAAGSTVIQDTVVSVNTTSITRGVLGAVTDIAATLPAGFSQTIASPVKQVTLAATTTVYCPASAVFSTSTLTIDGFIRARRVR